MNTSCVFCKIVQKQSQAKILYQDDLVTAFQDSRPAAPTHILIVPNQHITSVNEVSPEHEAVLGRMVVVARRLAEEENLENSGYRLLINTGPHAGQTVDHLHMHLMGGRRLPGLTA